MSSNTQREKVKQLPENRRFLDDRLNADRIADCLMSITDYVQALERDGNIARPDARILIDRSETALAILGWNHG